MSAPSIAICVLVALIIGLWTGAEHPEDARRIAGVAAIVVLVLVGVLIGGAL